ncbi:hypothetical protein SNE40_008919 [Patella caerulea]|uniref:Uncharacterized protein n=1 Tax=Patella caerulea TaxID=87958 RepID=A0AAN8Q2B5_PATCE
MGAFKDINICRQVLVVLLLLKFGNTIYVKDTQEDVNFKDLLQTKSFLPDGSNGGDLLYSTAEFSVGELLEDESLLPANEHLLSRPKRQTDTEGSGGGIIDETLPPPALFETSAFEDTVAGDDVVSAIVTSDAGVPFGNTLETEMFVGSNGIVSLGEAVNSPFPQADKAGNFLAGYWADIDQTTGGSIAYKVYDRAEGGSNINLLGFSFLVNQYYGIPTLNFQATWALLVSYNSVNQHKGPPTQEVTFQIILLTNGFDSYAMYLYKDGGMNWFQQLGTVFIGYSVAGSFNRILYSGTPAAFQIDQFVGNTGTRAFWIFKVGTAPNPAQECLNWYFRSSGNSVIRSAINRLPNCPCNIRSALRSYRFYDSRGDNLCFRRFLSFRTYPALRVCCYNRRTGVVDIAGSFNSSVSLAYGPFIPQLHQSEDILPRIKCCSESNIFCNLYRELRPVGRCRIRFRPRRAWMFGDPHVATLDGEDFTFNGLGEYTMLRIQSENFVLQARTAQVENSAGTLTNATVFSAFAARDDNGMTFQVELNRTKNGMNIFGNGEDLTRSFYEQEGFDKTFGNGSLTVSRSTDTTVQANFGESDISLSVKVGTKLLEFSITVPDDYRTETAGLMGNFNGDDSDDFALPNGTVLPSNLTERQIYHDFGQKWLITPSESVFQYDTRKGPTDFSFPGFVPIFLENQTEAVKNESYSVCGGSTNLPCIYDFIATGNRAVALETRNFSSEADRINDEIANTSPEINGTTMLNATVGEESIITVVGTDAEDGDGVTYTVVDQPDSAFSFNNQTKVATWTPADTNPVSISFVVKDSKDALSGPLNVQVRLCSGCNGRGTCDHSRTIQPRDETDNPLFQLVACICNTGWEGADCNSDIDACVNAPCLVGQTCTDRPAANHTVSNIGYDCSPCPDGYSEQGDSPKCTDVNECNTTNNCDQVCKNTEGSYTCSCNDGYRKQGFGTCVDINECDERSNGCDQLCTNTEGSFNCSCRSGYELAADSKSCNEASGSSTCLPSINCTHGCSDNECFCRIGFTLNSDNTTCDDEDECARNPNPCTQTCTNTAGSYTCSCLTGFVLASDGILCEECPIFTYGDGCRQTCDCSANGIACDKVRGCICKTGWRGENCTTDIDECTEGTFNCTADTTCDNTDGSYQCLCQSGYQKVNGNCQDTDECLDSSLNSCQQLCNNNLGSFACACEAGYKTDPANPQQCIDIDECSVGSSGCNQFCDNLVGSFNCRCEFGYALAGDRRTCELVEEVCAKFTNLNCSYACNVSLSGETPNCYCQSGYRLANDQETCLDIDECASPSTNLCSDTCTNQPGSYSCSCPIGKKLENDQRTCSDCDDSHWGENCANECGCGIGASRCDKITGCVCKNGWQGDKCQQDVDECNTVGICPQLSTCRNTPGNYSCDCREGYNLMSDTCQDIDECSSNTLTVCDTFCNNTIGSFICSCNPGFIFRSGSCQDIDECTTGTHNCDHTCRNVAGSFACECRTGYRINADMANKCDAPTTSSCSLSCDNCEQLTNGTERCFCTRGFELDADMSNCSDINECSVNPCSGGVCSQGGPGEFTCACPDGFQLDADQVTCKECPQGTYGPGCASTCDCFDATTTSCSNVNGSCSCVDGWQGTQCDEDKDECTTAPVPDCGPKASCLNTNGSFICKCNTGYFKSNGICVECDDTHWGDNCQETCQCVAGHVLSCSKTDGTCNCTDQWTGNTCQTDVDECQNQTICGTSSSQCVNVDGGYRCDCQDGYMKDANGNCQDKDECVDLPCALHEVCTNTIGNYTCTCPQGFTVVAQVCTDNNECGVNNGGCQQNCVNQNGTFKCECRSGYTLNNDSITCADIDECTTANICPKNLEVCKNVPGSFDCVCQDGYSLENAFCVDTDECNTNNGGCDQVCNNTVGSYSCSCNAGFTPNNDNKTCSDNFRVNVTLTVQDINNETRFLSDNTSADYKRVFDKLQQSLTDYFRPRVPDFFAIIIFALRPGSIEIDYQLVVRSLNGNTPNSTTDISTAIKALYDTGSLEVDGTKYPLNALTVNGVPVPGLSVCQVYGAVQGECSGEQVCDTDANGKPYCRAPKEDTSNDLIIGLGVGLPLFFLLFAIICVLVYLKIRSKNKQTRQNLIHESHPSYLFAGSLPKRSSHSAANYMPYIPDGYSVASSSSESGYKHKPKKTKGRDDFLDSAWYENGNSASNGNGAAESNFSWDYLHRMLNPDSRFEIQRPVIDGTPNPAFNSNDRNSRA